MSDEESFIVLGSTPTPSMEQYLYGGDPQKSFRQQPNNVSASTISNNFSLIQADESLKSTTGPKSGLGRAEPAASMGGNANGNSLAASVIMGEIKSSLLQAFPSLMHSSMPIDEVQMLQHLMNEHAQMKDSLQRANVAMRKNFTSIQKWQDDVKVKYTEQVRKLDEQRAAIEKLEAENGKLKHALGLAENRSREQEKQINERQLAIEKALEDAQKLIQAERASAAAEVEELKKAVSEKQSILQNMAKEIERLELEKQEFVVVKPNKPEPNDDSGVQFITKEEHDRQIKVLQREMSVNVAKNLELEDMQKIYIDELNCLKVNLTAAEEVHKKQRVQLERQAKDIETKDVSLAENIRELKTLAEQVDVLTAQLDIYKNDFEAERSARADLASEKDRILGDLKLLQKRNQQLIDEVQNGRVAEERATRAANEALNKRESPEASTSSAEPGASSSAAEEQTYERPDLRCPLCDGSFKDISTLQNHVEDCVGAE